MNVSFTEKIAKKNQLPLFLPEATVVNIFTYVFPDTSMSVCLSTIHGSVIYEHGVLLWPLWQQAAFVQQYLVNAFSYVDKYISTHHTVYDGVII